MEKEQFVKWNGRLKWLICTIIYHICDQKSLVIFFILAILSSFEGAVLMAGALSLGDTGTGVGTGVGTGAGALVVVPLILCV